jgi:S1-C subfamily serine protease
MRQLRNILIASILLFGTLAIRWNHQDIVQLQNSVKQAQQTLDPSVLDSCGIITNGQSSGSVVVIGPHLILTAGHCIDIPDSYVEVSGQRYEIISKWRAENLDVGFAEVDGRSLPHLEFGQIPKLLDIIYLVGTPYNRAFTNTIVTGIVGKLDLEYIDPVVNWTGCFISNMLICAGNSGGPVFNKYGRIVGMCVGRMDGGDSFCVCVPVDDILTALGAYQTQARETIND